MKYITLALFTATIFLGYRSYETSKKVDKLTTVVNKINELLTTQDPPLIAEGTTIPDFSLPNAENNLISLDAYAEASKKVLVFTAVGCHYCEQYYPELASFSEKNKDIPLIVFQNGASVEENKAFLTEKHYTFEMLQGTDQIYDSFMVSGTPTTIVVDADNKVLKAGYFSTAKEIEEAL